MADMSVEKLIEDLGGTGAVAAGIGAELNTVSNWRTRGIPAGRWLAIVALAKKRGVRGVTFERLASLQPAKTPAEARP